MVKYLYYCWLASPPKISFFFKQVLPIVSSFLFHYTNEPFLWCKLLRLITLASENRNWNSRRGMFANNCVKSVKFHSIFSHTKKASSIVPLLTSSIFLDYLSKNDQPLLYKSLPHPPCPWLKGRRRSRRSESSQRVIFEATLHPYS
jgi:hypothetical protein